MDLLARFSVHLLETLFFLGITGSACVVVLALYEDLHEVFQKDEPPV
jgi:hypothetical protein